MAARKVTDWTRLQRMIPKHQMTEFNAFRTRSESLRGALAAVPEAKGINWDHYRSVVKNKALVEDFATKYAAVVVPFPEDTKSAEIEARNAAHEVEILAELAQMEKNCEEWEKELAHLKGMKPYEQMSLSEYADMHPEKYKAFEDHYEKVYGYRYVDHNK